MYFVIFKKKSEDKYRLYSNTIFSEEKEAKQFAKKSMKRNEQYKVVEYTIENIDDYWY
jgi:AAA15 family ATPase/GTPase|tara:strand:+ start:27 stop:200 length:174 start_codon:yes stop_codon:yes gene_type:complete